MPRKPKRKRVIVPDLFFECALCGDEIEVREILRVDGSHADLCARRPVLLRLDSDPHGNWVPIIQAHGNLTDKDKKRIRTEIEKLIEHYDDLSESLAKHLDRHS